MNRPVDPSLFIEAFNHRKTETTKSNWNLEFGGDQSKCNPLIKTWGTEKDRKETWKEGCRAANARGERNYLDHVGSVSRCQGKSGRQQRGSPVCGHSRHAYQLTSPALSCFDQAVQPHGVLVLKLWRSSKPTNVSCAPDLTTYIWVPRYKPIFCCASPLKFYGSTSTSAR